MDESDMTAYILERLPLIQDFISDYTHSLDGDCQTVIPEAISHLTLLSSKLKDKEKHINELKFALSTFAFIEGVDCNEIWSEIYNDKISDHFGIRSFINARNALAFREIK